MTKKIIINEKIRLDKYLVSLLKISRTKASELIKLKQIYVNEMIIDKPSFQLKKNDQIKIINSSKTKQININLKPCKEKLNIIYEDKYLLVINKPKNVLVHPTKFNEENTIANRLINYLGNFSHNKIRPGIVHRLDRNTTGLLVVAKDLTTLTLLKKQIEEKTMIRKYICLCHNHFSIKKIIIDQAIDHDRKNKTTKMIVSSSKRAKKAITEIRVLKNLKNNLSLVECILYTGRTHQIRVHLKFINHCVYNDDLYGRIEDKKNYGQFLHAYKLSFIHP
ncbi:RluA family pseudouridine synthase [bacterium]|nr:RluA family pseudouridine synthase [bacterium]